MSGIIQIVVGLLILGLIVWLCLWVVPLPYPFGHVIVAVAVVLGLIWALKKSGGISGLD